MTEIKEGGPWRASHRTSHDGEILAVYVLSDDFTHDVSLHVLGDFAEAAERLAYAEEIARRLNEWQKSNK